MSLFTNTSANPERVWALLRILDALGGRGERKLLYGLLDPDLSGRRPPDEPESASFTQTVQAAGDLGLVERLSGRPAGAPASPARSELASSGEMPKTFAALSDRVHAHLANLGPDEGDRLVLDGFSLVAASADQHGGTLWFSNLPRADQIERMNRQLDAAPVQYDSRFNPSRMATWHAWNSFLGLTSLVPYGGRDGRPYPYVAPRLAREIASADATSLTRGVEMPARDFLAWVAQRMPYLDGGRRYRALLRLPSQETGSGGDLASRGRVSVLLSTALRDLHDDGVLRLSTVGDAADNLTLADDPFHAVGAFRTVTVGPAREETTQ